MLALLVHNPKAGSGRPTGEELLAALDAAGFSATYCSSKDGNLDEALTHPADIVIVAGGDGTVAKIARTLKDRKTLVAILPSGTANNIARCLGIAGDAGAMVAALRGAPIERLDIGVAVGPWGTRHFVEAVGWGALAKAVDPDVPGDSNLPRIERGRASFAKTVAEYEAKRFAFAADGEEIEAISSSSKFSIWA
jgi:diacylglycerol kinase (ATP)